MYTTNEELCRLILFYRTTNDAGPLLVKVDMIAKGLWGRFQFALDPDDFRQDCCITIMRKIHNVDLTKNVFGWMTQICFNLARAQLRAKSNERAKHSAYGKALKRSGRIPNG